MLHISNIVRDPIKQPLYVLTTVFNARRFRSRWALYDAFEKHMHDSGAILYTAECSFGERAFAVTSPNDTRDLQITTSSEIWHKERMLNLLMQRLPRDWKYVAWCFTGDNLVEVETGLKRIDEIIVGDKVKTHDGTLQRVNKILKRPYKQGQPLKWIHTTHSKIVCTPEHPFFITRGIETDWCEAKDLLPSDILMYPYPFTNKDILNLNINYNLDIGGSGKIGVIKKNNAHIDDIEVDEDFARFLGLYLAEGCSIGDGIAFTLHNNETELHKFIVEQCLEKFHRNTNLNTRWATTIKLNIQSLSSLFKEWFGYDAKSKKVPDFVFNWGLKNKLSFIKGFLEGDGNKREVVNGEPIFQGSEVASRLLLEGLLKLLKETGLSHGAEIKERSRVTPYGKEEQTHYRLSISKISYNKLLDILSSTTLNDRYLGIPIVSIEDKNMYKANYESGNYVYNLEVDRNNSYIVQSVIVHNCDADIQFTRPDWVRETIHLLQHYQVIQLFSRAQDLSPCYEPLGLHSGFVHDYKKGITSLGNNLPGYYYGPGKGGGARLHPGFAWAARREALDGLGGFLDFAILGAADNHMAKALIGKARDSFHPRVDQEYKNGVMQYQERALRHIKKNIGYLEGTVNHFWHGKKIDRRYWDRWKILVRNQFDPWQDLKQDWQGLYQLDDDRIQLRDEVREYFAARNEDSIDM